MTALTTLLVMVCAAFVAIAIGWAVIVTRPREEEEENNYYKTKNKNERN